MKSFSAFIIVCALFCYTAQYSVAQDDQTLYVQLGYMKSLSPDYVAMEQEIFKPIHEQRIKDGDLVSWTVYFVGYGDRSEYDYVIANVYRGIEGVANQSLNWEAAEKKAHPGKDLTEVYNNLGTKREQVRLELWELASEVEESPMVGSHISFGFAKSAPGKSGIYRTVESETWTPMNTEWVRLDPFRTGHKFLALREPSGASLPYDYAFLQTFDGRGITDVSWRDAFAAAHPDRDINAAAEEVRGLRTIILDQTWLVVAHASE